MIDASVETFFSKNAADGYAAQYDKDHGPRLDAMIAKWDLRTSLAGKRVVDVGGGLGFLGKRLDPTTDYLIIDGAKDACRLRQRPGGNHRPQDTEYERQGDPMLCKGTYVRADLDHETFSDLWGTEHAGMAMTRNWRIDMGGPFDAAFCLETLEHLTNPYHCLAEIKKLVKPDGDVYLSIPHANVWHNYIYPALMVDPSNFAQFLGQMALPVTEYWLWDRGWNAHHFKCRNAAWHEKKMLYEKSEEKFRNTTPVEMVNL